MGVAPMFACLRSASTMWSSQTRRRESMNCGNIRQPARIPEMIQPSMCGQAPVPRNTSAVAMTFYIETVRVLGYGSVRGTYGVVSIAICMASMVLWLGIGHGRNHHTCQRTVGDESLHAFHLRVQRRFIILNDSARAWRARLNRRSLDMRWIPEMRMTGCTRLHALAQRRVGWSPDVGARSP